MSPTDKVTPPARSSNPTITHYEVIADADADRGAWLEARKSLITASDVPAILGLPQPGARLDLFYRKRDEIDGKRLPEYVKEAGELGHILEDGNARLFKQKTGRIVYREQKLLRSTKYPWLGCTLDYSQTKTSLDPMAPLELKITSVEGKWDDKLGPCPEWQIQMTTQCLVTGASWGSLSALFGSPTFHHRHEDIELDKELAEMIAVETEYFANLIESNTPPKWGEDVDTYEVIKRLDERRVKQGSEIVLNKDLLAADMKLTLLKAKKSKVDAESRTLDKQCKELEALFGTAIGEHTSGRLPNGIVYSFNVTHVSAKDSYHYRSLRRVEPESKPVRGTRETAPRRGRKKS